MKKYIKELIEDELAATSYRKGIDWQGYQVYIPEYEGCPVIGLPYVVLQKGEEIRISTPEESLDYLDYEQGRRKACKRRKRFRQNKRF